MRVVSGIDAAGKLLNRRTGFQATDPAVEQSVRAIIEQVRAGGDKILKELTAKYDGARLDRIEVTAEEIQKARNAIDPGLLDALETAAGQITSYHSEQFTAIKSAVDAMGSRQLLRPLDRVGVYAPGGKAFYPSTVLMTAIPAREAGVKEVILATPPGSDGRIPLPTLAAAAIAGVDRVFAVGGAQAVAALAYGTETIPQVDKICGPGNVYVMTAKKMVFGHVAIDGLQGPSEVLIIADETTDPVDCAADILAQAEHDPLAQSVLVTTSHKLAGNVLGELKLRMRENPRHMIIEQSLEQRGIIAVVASLEEAVELANLYAPEHLCFLAASAGDYLASLRHAGCIFIGEKATVAVGDYVAGPSHALPTSGTARFSSPLNIWDFVKITDVVNVDADMIFKYGPAAVTIARAEGLENHARAIEARYRGVSNG
ncbi:MAG: histidinol dehydrogenase [Dehalogenimonas sp.]|uniref:Histidinol dehydrogenase n=1 Tax=Candidatus Dehalogenimonas loeffleri TaxID=3127115 RepID=A0ABZ2J330_9CHLR|nr:histidinol dehydrogenase [Dehalogenimonas sp.]